MANGTRVSLRVPKPSTQRQAPPEWDSDDNNRIESGSTRSPSVEIASPATRTRSKTKNDNSSSPSAPLNSKSSSSSAASGTSRKRKATGSDGIPPGNGEFGETSPDEDEDEDEDNEIESVPAPKRPKKSARNSADAADDSEPTEITYNISIYTPTEFSKPAKKREAAASGFLKALSTKSFDSFERQVFRKLSSMAKLAIAPDDNMAQVQFQVPRHVVNYLDLDDLDAYEHMVASAMKCKDPTVNLAVELDIKTKNNENVDEPPSKGKKSKGKRTKIPSENDVLPGNKVISDKIQLLRAKWTCHANDGSDYCWVSGDMKEHLPLGHAHFNMWAAAWANDAADADTPPNHKIFEVKGGVTAAPTLLQRRLAANNATNNAPVINNHFAIPDGLLDLLRPNAPAAAPAAPIVPVPAPSSIALHNEPMLLPPGTVVGPRLSMAAFCGIYELDDSIVEKFAANGYKNASVMYLIKLADLEKMQFLPGKIAELRDAVRQWALPAE
ncbi:hypothetical protein B0H17DRAFT_1210147 [Mycena rosella]|uniref:Uncharacterized protein n=1 Tax=Mycena rosella TaxID=1033263 RepID=A0AAD7G5D2_MYCRO|nr:hypothetical protein B0H17DRAFT_1210147 [Mycena rosella]